MSNFQEFLIGVSTYGVGAGLTAGIMFFFYALKHEDPEIGGLFFDDTPLPFFATLMWPVGLPLLITFHGCTKIAGGLARLIRRRQERLEHDDNLRKLEMIQAEKEVEKLLNG